MKDAKGHGSNARGGTQATMDYEARKAALKG